MTATAASAPGKVVLTGEYAVLDGAPAIAMAVNRRAVATARNDGRGEVHSLGLDGRNERELLDHVAATLGPGAVMADAGSFTLDTQAFTSRDGIKLGIGSSAALTVALAKCLAPGSSEPALVAAAAAAHRRFQGGAGSGIDIAVSAAGGLIEYQREGAQATGLRWPAGLQFALLWSGVAASTRERIERLGATTTRPSRHALADAAVAAAAAWRSGKANSVVAATRDFADMLERFSVDHELGIFEAGHDNLRQEAKRHDLVYKPCGAGGGDIGIALTTDPPVLEHFVAFAGQSGFACLDLELDPAGVRTEGG